MGLLLESRQMTLREEGAAFLTSAVIARSYEVETTSRIVNTWKEMQELLPLDDDIDFISAILVTGRIMDFKEEFEDPDRIPLLLTSTKQALLKADADKGDSKKMIMTAFLTAAFVSETEEIESTSKIMEIWEDLNEELEFDDERDIIPALLAVGRISELKKRFNETWEIVDIYNRLRTELLEHFKRRDIVIKNGDIVTAYLASALIGISPKVERIRDLINTWLGVREAVDITDDEDLISIILAAGRVRDLDAMHLTRHGDIAQLVKKIKTNLLKVSKA